MSLCFEALLNKWQLSEHVPVDFDSDQLDVVLNGEQRKSAGKGVRALAYAAFALALLTYAREVSASDSVDIPHPGLIILDSPLTTLKEAYTAEGPDTTNNDEDVPSSVKNAFYTEVAKQFSKEQIIVFENVAPPSDLLNNIAVVHFTRLLDEDRYGFFPMG
jgi:hypothetical protein